MVSRLIVPAGGGRQRSFMPGELFTWKTTSVENGAGFDFGELSLQPGVRVPEHIHNANDEAYYILNGTYRFKVGDEIADVSTGSFVLIPKGTAHAWVHTGSEPGLVLLTFCPGGMAGYFDELAPLVPDMMIGMADSSKMDPDVLGTFEAVANRYGYEITGPPLA